MYIYIYIYEIRKFCDLYFSQSEVKEGGGGSFFLPLPKEEL